MIREKELDEFYCQNCFFFFLVIYCQTLEFQDTLATAFVLCYNLEHNEDIEAIQPFGKMNDENQKLICPKDT